MLRNKHFYKEKEWRQLDRRMDELYNYKYASRWGRIWHRHGVGNNPDQYMLWVPLEKPVFAGWEVWVTLGEAGLRRRDAPKILDVLKVLRVGEDNAHHISNSRSIRIIRDGKHSYVRIEGSWRSRYNKRKWGYAWGLEQLFNKKITAHQYANLKDDLKPYFSPNWYDWDTWYKHVKKSDKPVSYTLNEAFPKYELIIKVKKSYNTYIGHLYGDEIGEYEKLHRYLWSEQCAPQRKAVGYHSRDWRDRRWTSSLKRAWRDTSHLLTVAANCHGHDCEDWIEIEEEVERQTKVRNIYTFGRW